MIGAIIGDIVGSYWEFKEEKVRDAPFFIPESTITDDSILTLATASAIMDSQFYTRLYKFYTQKYPNYGYGPSFVEWAHTADTYITENHSYGNGAAMRVSPIGWAFDTPQRVMMEAQQSSGVTHCHPNAIMGAQATALAVYLARAGTSKADLKDIIENWFEYNLLLDLDDLHENYSFDITCQGTVTVALACVIQADSFEEVMRNGLYVGGDTDTLLAIAGSIAEPLYGVPSYMREEAEKILGKHSLQLLGILKDFEKKYGAKKAEDPSFFKTILNSLVNHRR